MIEMTWIITRHKDWLLPILPVLSVPSSTLECHLNEWLKRNQVNCLKSWKGWTIWWGSDEERRRLNEWLKWSVLPKPNLPFKLRFFSSLTTFSFIFTHFICILRIINELLMKMSIEQKEQNSVPFSCSTHYSPTSFSLLPLERKMYQEIWSKNEKKEERTTCSPGNDHLHRQLTQSEVDEGEERKWVERRINENNQSSLD